MFFSWSGKLDSASWERFCTYYYQKLSTILWTDKFRTANITQPTSVMDVCPQFSNLLTIETSQWANCPSCESYCLQACDTPPETKSQIRLWNQEQNYIQTVWNKITKWKLDIDGSERKDKATKILMRILLGKWSLETLKRKWADPINKDVKQTEWEGGRQKEMV
jgi:hypothetical protein